MSDKSLTHSQELFNDSELSNYYESIAEMLEDENNELSDKIFEIADGMVDIYNYDLKKWAGTPEGQEYTERAIDEFGWDGVGGELIKAYQMGQYLLYREQVEAEFEEIKNEFENEEK